jgi:site-specific DNA-methyltransferase (adenine-specific)
MNQFTKDNITLINGDCLVDLPAAIEDGSVTLAFLDLPYGQTDCGWDNKLSIPDLFTMLKKKLKPNGLIVATATMKFALGLCTKQDAIPFRFDMVYQKTVSTGFGNAKRLPLRSHELLLFFYNKSPFYNPCLWQKPTTAYLSKKRTVSRRKDRNFVYNGGGLQSSGYSSKIYDNNTKYHPTSVITFQNAFGNESLHQTPKPVQLCLWLLQTYTKPGDLVIDPTFGSGVMAIACKDSGRHFIGTELDTTIYAKAVHNVDNGIDKKFYNNTISVTPFTYNGKLHPKIYKTND